MGREWSPTDGTGSEGGARGGPAAGGRKAGRGRLPNEPAQTKARRLRSARGGGQGASAGADGCGPPPQAARRPRLTPALAPHRADRPDDSPSRAVPISWSSRARICAWADMVAGESGGGGRDESSQREGSNDHNDEG